MVCVSTLRSALGLLLLTLCTALPTYNLGYLYIQKDSAWVSESVSGEALPACFLRTVRIL